MQHVKFSLHLSADDYRSYYQGVARKVSVVAEDGRRIEFPAANLRPFLTHAGIHGVFEMSFDDQHKLQEIKRIA